MNIGKKGKVGDYLDGYVRLYRKLLENPIFQNANLLKVFIWCLIKATYKNREVLVGLKPVSLEPGQFVYGRHKASEELKIKPSTLNDYMNTLKLLKIIGIQSNNRFSVITIVNWELYQSDEEKSDSKTAGQPTSGRQVTNTNNKDKNNIYSSSFEEFWDLYPRKVGKTEAFSQWKARLKDGVSESTLIKSAHNYSIECKRKGTEADFIKHPRTFLSSKRPYEDYITVQAVTKPTEQSGYRDLSDYIPGGDN